MERRNGRDGRATLGEIFIVMRDPRLTESEKVLWCLYRSYDSGNGAWPGDDLLATQMGKSVRSVQAYRAGLIGKGYLAQRFRGPHPAAHNAVVPEQASQNPATLADESLAESCDPSPKASQEASQVSANLPPYPPNTEEYGSTETRLPTTDGGRAVVRFFRRVGAEWCLKISPDEWAASLTYPGVNIPRELSKAADWVDENNAERKSWTRFIHNWLKKADPESTATPISDGRGGFYL